MRKLLLLLALLGLPAFAGYGWGQAAKTPSPSTAVPAAGTPTAIIEAAKKATSLVVVGDDEAYGTAFCIDASGLFVTNYHVVEEEPKLSVVVYAGEAGQKVLPAHVLRVNKTQDFALLQVEGANQLTALELGTIDGLTETQAITAFGYPFGRELAIGRGAYPGITVSTGHITALRRDDGVLQQVQVDASLNPGNSGGPVLDGQGKVIGIVDAGIPGAALNFAIPVNQLNKFLAAPTITFNPQPIPFNKQSVENSFRVRVNVLDKNPQPLTVTLSFSAREGDGRAFTAKEAGDGTYIVQAVPVPPRQGAATLQITASNAGNSIVGSTKDRDLQIGAAQLKMSGVQRFEQKPVPHATLVGGQILTGKIAGLDAVEVSVGSVPITLNLSKFDSVSVVDIEPRVEQVKYRVTVRRGATLIGELKGTIGILPAEAVALPVSTVPGSSATGAIINPPLLDQDKTVIRLPAAVEDVAVAAGGRYFVFWLKRLHKLAIFDVNSARVIKFLPVEAEDIVFTAGLQKLIVAINDQGTLQRWDLTTFERELTIPTPDGMHFQSLAMGSATNGPVLAAGSDLRVTFIDPMTLKPMDVTIKDQPWVGGHAFPRFQVRAARDGSVFAGWVPASSIHGTYTITLHGKTAETRFHRQWTAFAVPAPDGSIIYTDRGIITPEMQSIEPERFNATASLPVIDSSSYFLSFAHGGDWGDIRLKSPPGLYSAADHRLLITLPDLPEVIRSERPSWEDSRPAFETLDKQVYYLISAQLLLTISNTKDELVLRHLNIVDAMDKAGIDYLFISSWPMQTVTKGQRFVYQLDVKSKRGGVVYSLASGPPGMTLSPTGRLEWPVPRTYAAAAEDVIISIRDASGQAIFHSFKLTLQ